MQVDSSLPDALLAEANVAANFQLGTESYDGATRITNGAFGNSYKLHRSTTEQPHSELYAKLLVDKAEQVDVERLHVQALWETYMLLQVAQRSAQVPSESTSVHRFLDDFVQLDRAVLFRDSATLVLRLADDAAVTLYTLLDRARQLRATDDARVATLPFNEALAHLCTVELCEIVLTLVTLGIVHTDLRPEHILVTRMTIDAKAGDTLRYVARHLCLFQGRLNILQAWHAKHKTVTEIECIVGMLNSREETVTIQITFQLLDFSVTLTLHFLNPCIKSSVIWYAQTFLKHCVQ
jgi:hypothetical protein